MCAGKSKHKKITCKRFYKHFTLLVKCKIQHHNNRAAVFIHNLIHLMMASQAKTCSVKYIIIRDRGLQSMNSGYGQSCTRDGEVRIPKLEYTVQQDASVQYNIYKCLLALL
jgi:hypothetical protein